MNRKKQLDELENKLKDGIAMYFASDRYKELLKTMSVFHSYSFRNSLLILLQMPEASYVASFTAWKKLNRVVKRGEKAIRIFAPMKIKNEQKDDEKRERLLFRAVSVFDYSQTCQIPELPEVQLGIKELTGTVADYEELFQMLQNISPVPVYFEEIAGEAKGYYSEPREMIALQSGMSELQNIKTLLHELTHALLHNAQSLGDRKPSRDTKEIEAESVAFMVSQMMGLDTSSYSFEYIGSWESKNDMKLLNESMSIIRKTANHIITLLFPENESDFLEATNNGTNFS